MSEKFYRVKNWQKYQSYKDRKPSWIRLHHDLLDNYDFQTLSADARALLPMLWLLACEDEDPKSGIIRYPIRKISFRLRLTEKNITNALTELQAVDFIECIETVTKPYSNRTQTVTPETETETETETELELHPREGKKFLKPDEISDELWNDFCTLRKTKRAPITQTVINTFRREATKAGKTLAEALEICCANGWAGFKADWLKNQQRYEKFDPLKFINKNATSLDPRYDPFSSQFDPFNVDNTDVIACRQDPD